MIFSISNLDSTIAAKLCEQYISIVGIVLLVPIFSPEEEVGVKETVETRYTSQLYIYVVRIFIAIFMMILLIGLAVFILTICGGIFNAGTLLAGTFATALFLGSLGLFIAAVSRQLTAGYMVPTVYFIMDMMTKGKYTKDFFLFSLINNSFREKYYLFGAAVVFIVASLLAYIIGKRRR